MTLFEAELVQVIAPVNIQVAVYVPVVLTIICAVVALFDHLRLPVEHTLSRVIGEPHELLLPPIIVIEGVEGVLTTVATTAERFAPAVSQPEVLSLHPTKKVVVAEMLGEYPALVAKAVVEAVEEYQIGTVPEAQTALIETATVAPTLQAEPPDTELGGDGIALTVIIYDT